MKISLVEYTDLLKKYEELRQEKIKILNKYYVEKDDLKKEIERLNNTIKYTESWIDRTIEIIKQQPSEDDTWILERLNGIKQCLKGVDK